MHAASPQLGMAADRRSHAPPHHACKLAAVRTAPARCSWMFGQHALLVSHHILTSQTQTRYMKSFRGSAAGGQA